MSFFEHMMDCLSIYSQIVAVIYRYMALLTGFSPLQLRVSKTERKILQVVFEFSSGIFSVNSNPPSPPPPPPKFKSLRDLWYTFFLF